MEVILIEEVRNLGRRGDVVTVKPGYARNYLLPQGMALTKNRANMAFFEQQKKKYDAIAAKERAEALEIAGAITSTKVIIKKRVGETETLYGSVTSAEVAEKLADKGITVDKRRIDLGVAHGIKTLGEHTVKIDVHPDIMAELIVSVEPSEE